MKVSDNGLALIKKFEGCRLTAYADVGGVWTIGWGQTGPDVVEGLTITQAQADARLRAEVDRFAEGVLSGLKVPVNQNQFDALVSFAYNVGLGAFRSSTL